MDDSQNCYNLTMKVPWNQPDSESLRNHWNKVAKDLKDFSSAPSTLYYRQSEINLMQSLFGQLKGKKLLKLDLWNEFNNTKILFWAAEQGAKVYGLDIADYLVKNASRQFKKAGFSATFTVCDIRNILFPDNSFDFVYSMGTIEHIDDYNLAIREIYRVLKPGGKAIVGVPNKLDPFLRPLLVWFLEWLNAYAYSPEHSFTHRQLKRLHQEAGFKVIAQTGLLFMPGILRMMDIFFYLHIRPLCLLTKILIKPFEFLERKYSWARKNGYLIACYVQKPKGKGQPRKR